MTLVVGRHHHGMALGVEKHIVRCEDALARSCKSKDLVRRDRVVRRRDRLRRSGAPQVSV